MGLVLLIILVLLFAGGIPSFGFHEYGWGPSGGIGVILVIVLVLVLLGRF